MRHTPPKSLRSQLKLITHRTKNILAEARNYGIVIQLTCFYCRAVDFWLNTRSVRTAIHAAQPETAGVFYIGNRRLEYNYDIFDIIPLHKSNIESGEGLRLWHVLQVLYQQSYLLQMSGIAPPQWISVMKPKF